MATGLSTLLITIMLLFFAKNIEGHCKCPCPCDQANSIKVNKTNSVNSNVNQASSVNSNVNQASSRVNSNVNQASSRVNSNVNQASSSVNSNVNHANSVNSNVNHANSVNSNVNPSISVNSQTNSQISSKSTFDITKYGAKADGATDISMAFTSAWKEACASPIPCMLLIPAGIFLMNSVLLQGPCKAPLEFRLEGTLKAPSDVAAMKGAEAFLSISTVDRLTVTGGGVFDGQGAKAWAANQCANNQKCSLPMNLVFNSITNSIIRDIISKDSKNFHVNLVGCKNFTLDSFTADTPATSISTDGIHLSRSSDIRVINTKISSGADCVSIAEGTQNLHVENVHCGPGHGFSIGSLGRVVGEADVAGIFFRNCTLAGTENGLRIKSWPSSPSGYKSMISNIHFENIFMNDVLNPVIIDQTYCPFNHCNKMLPSLVKIMGVTFKNIHGTFRSQEAMKFICSHGFPCENIELGDINLKFVGKLAGGGGGIVSHCMNVRPTLFGHLSLPICTHKMKLHF